MMLPTNEAELRVFVRDACQAYGKLMTGEVKGGVCDRHIALAAEHDAIVALRRLLKRKGLSTSQVQTEVLAVRASAL